jgi:hypothetical protein
MDGGTMRDIAFAFLAGGFFFGIPGMLFGLAVGRADSTDQAYKQGYADAVSKIAEG